MNNSAFIVAVISGKGVVLSIGIYSAGPTGLTRTGRDCHYAQLGPEFSSTSYAAAKALAETYYTQCHHELAQRFPLT